MGERSRINAGIYTGAWMVSEKMGKSTEEQSCLPRQSYLFQSTNWDARLALLLWDGRTLHCMARYTCVRCGPRSKVQAGTKTQGGVCLPVNCVLTMTQQLGISTADPGPSHVPCVSPSRRSPSLPETLTATLHRCSSPCSLPLGPIA